MVQSPLWNSIIYCKLCLCVFCLSSFSPLAVSRFSCSKSLSPSGHTHTGLRGCTSFVMCSVPRCLSPPLIHSSSFLLHHPPRGSPFKSTQPSPLASTLAAFDWACCISNLYIAPLLPPPLPDSLLLSRLSCPTSS